MSGVNEIGNALETGAAWDADTMRRALARLQVVAVANDVQDIDYSELHKDALPQIIFVRATQIAYAYDSADTTSEHDGVTVLKSVDNKRFKASLQPSAFTNVLDIVGAPSGSEVAGDRYLVNSSPTGTFASYAKKLVYKNGAGDWVAVTPLIGQRVYVRDEEADYQYGEDGSWHIAGDIAAGAVGAQELAFPWGMVVESETATPAGTRATGATPTVPLGGTAANINDNNSATTSTTSALGNLTGAAVGSRIIAMLDLGADTALKAIEAKQLAASTGSSSASAMGFYYATAAAPSTWVQLGAGFTLTTTPTDFVRSGTFTARYVAVVTEAKNWSTATHVIGDLNAYKAATSEADGTKYIVAANAIGAWSGQDGKVAEAWGGAYRFYTAYDGALVLNRALKAQRRYDSTSGAWESASGAWITLSETQTDGTAPYSVGSNNYSYDPSTGPNTSTLRTQDPVGVKVAAKFVGQRLRIKARAGLNLQTGSAGFGGLPISVALFRDSDVNAIAWHPWHIWPGMLGTNFAAYLATEMEFYVTATDTSDHTYYYAVTEVQSSGTNKTRILNLAHRHMSVEGARQ